MRKSLGLHKTSNKLSEVFEAHCVDSYALAYSYVGGQFKPDNKDILVVTPINKHYRKLNVQNPIKGGIRKKYGGTRSLGFERGSIVLNSKYGFVYIGGSSKGRLSLHCLKTGKRLCQNAKKEKCLFKSFNSFTFKKRKAAFPPTS